MCGLPFIDDYALTCSRHPSLEGGYRQWLLLVEKWGYKPDESVWSIAFYKTLFTDPNGEQCANQYLDAWAALQGLGLDVKDE